LGPTTIWKVTFRAGVGTVATARGFDQPPLPSLDASTLDVLPVPTVHAAVTTPRESTTWASPVGTDAPPGDDHTTAGRVQSPAPELADDGAVTAQASPLASIVAAAAAAAIRRTPITAPFADDS
jgi:hypothetical protein